MVLKQEDELFVLEGYKQQEGMSERKGCTHLAEQVVIVR